MLHKSLFSSVIVRFYGKITNFLANYPSAIMSVISRIIVIMCVSSDETPHAMWVSGDVLLSSVLLLLDRFDRVGFFLS